MERAQRRGALEPHRASASVIKLLFILALLSAGIWTAYNVIPVYNTEWDVQDAFDSIAKNLSGQSAAAIRTKLPDIFHAEYIAPHDLPTEFYDHLQIRADGRKVEISSSYHVTLWLLGPLESVNPDGNSTFSGLKGMDKLRDKARLDFDFKPHAVTP